MTGQISLKEAERKAFRTKTDDGLWDVLLGCFFLMFPIAIYLSPSLGDFWSSMVFLPFWGLVLLTILLVRKYVVTPRVGMVKFGQRRKTRLMKFVVLMVVINAIALVLGIVAAMTFGIVPGQLYSIFLGLILLIGFSAAAYFLDLPRLYVYGLLLWISPIVGEWLWSQGYVSHHGFPLTFGVTSGIMIITGLVIFIRLLRDNPLPHEETPSEGAGNG